MNDLFLVVSSIRWQDLVDITLNSYILFRLYVLFRGTNAFRILVGIAVLWLAQRTAVYLGLIVTSWAMQGIMAVAALIVIVVFRNEIRSVLQGKNLKAFFWGFFRHERSITPVEIIVESVYELAKNRHGALIVLPAIDDLRENVQSGIPWKGAVSREMILSIFWPDNPVHDGAAIIQGDRVREVGAILPLSHREDLPSYYGTRHRAAFGLAEATDALVIVVSEERGEVSVAQGNRIIHIHDNVELTRLLEEHLGLAQTEQGNLKREKVEIGIAALVSVLFIVGVWFSFARGLETLVTLEVPVEYMSRDPNLEILETSVNTVRLDMSGSGVLIKAVRPEHVQVKLDLGKALAGRNTFTITRENISLPPGIILKKVEPPAVEVTLDVPTKKELPVQVDWSGKLPDHMIMTDIRVEPDKVQVIGGGRILENIATLYTQKVPMDNIRESGSLVVNLALNPASLKIAPGSKDRVTVEYTVKERPKPAQEG